MDNNINFKDLWKRQTIRQPNPDDLFLQINNLKKKHLRKLIATNLLLTITSVFILIIWANYQPQLLTTKIGIILIILAMIIYLFAYNRSYSLLKNRMDLQSNSDYLKNLLAIKSKQKFMQTIMLNLYFILLTLGIGLYMYEYTSRMTTFGGILVYGITSIWILINWFYLRPRKIKKEQRKLDDIIAKFKMLNKQLGE